MKVISIGLDSQTLNPESVVASRNVMYGEIVEKYTIVLPASTTTTLVLSNSVTVYGVGGWNKAVQFWKIYKLVSALARTGAYDVITTQDTYFLGFIGVMLSRKYHCGLEVQVLGIEKLNFFRKMLTKYVLKRAGSIRVLSPRLKKRLVAEFGIDDSRMMLVPIYVDVSSLGFSNSALTEEEVRTLGTHKETFNSRYGSRFNVVSVNRLVPIKNIDMQLEAIASLRNQFPQILLHIVGDGPLQEILEKEVQRLKIEEHVILHGFKSGVHLSPFFTQSDCFVLTSDFEGYGMVVVEAATAGLPILMTDVGCAGEVIVDGKSGMIVPPKDTKAFTASLKVLLEDESLRGRLQKEALQSIVELPSFDIVLQKYKASWQQALDNR